MNFSSFQQNDKDNKYEFTLTEGLQGVLPLPLGLPNISGHFFCGPSLFPHPSALPIWPAAQLVPEESVLISHS